MGQSLSSWEQLIKTLRKKPADLKIGNELNRGAWGIVYDGVLGRRPVAVKAIHEGLFKDVENGDTVVRNFCTECDRLEAMKNNHVIGECLVLSQLAYILSWMHGCLLMTGSALSILCM